MNDPKRGLTIHFTDGSKVSYTFTKQTDDPAAMRVRLTEALKSPFLMIAADGVLTAIPMANIKAIQLPIDSDREFAALPGTVIRDATLTRGDL
jgi:hypothetical protein